MAVPRYTCVEGGASKFWEGSVEGSVLTLTFGRIGTAGQTKEKDLGTPEAAQKELARLIREKTGKGYVSYAEEPAASGPARARSGADDAYPFLFYGASPSDWADGDRTYDVRFVEPPDAANRLKVAEVFEKAAHESAIDPDGDNWLWAGSWVLLTVGESPDGNGRRNEAMARIFRKLHESVPVAEVVFWNVTEDNPNDRWTRWSIGRQARPTTEPAWHGYEPVSEYGQTSDPSLGAGERDAAFEERRRKIRVELEMGPAVPKGKIGVVPAGSDAPRPAAVEPSVAKLLEARGTVSAAGGAAVAVKGDPYAGGKLFFVGPRGEVEAAATPWDVRSATVAPDGKSVLFAAWSRPGESPTVTRIFEMSLPGGEIRQIARFGSRYDAAMAFVGGDRIVVSMQVYEYGEQIERLFMLDRRSGREIGRSEPIADIYGIAAARGGRLVFVPTGKTSKPVVVVRTDGDTFEKVASIGPLFHEVWEAGGRVYAGGRAPGCDVFEVVNVDAVLAKEHAVKPVAQPLAPQPGRIGLVPVDGATAPRPAPDRRSAAITPAGNVAYTDDAGVRREVAVEGRANVVTVTPDAALGLVSATIAGDEPLTRLFRLDFATGDITHLDTSDWWDEYATAVRVGRDRYAYLIMQYLFLMELADDGEQYHEASPLDGAVALSAARDGTLLFVRSSTRPVRVFGVKDDRFVMLGELTPSFRTVWEARGRILAGDPDDLTAPVFEVVHVDEALAKA